MEGRISHKKLPLDYMVQEYWVGVQSPPNVKVDYMGMVIQDGSGKIVGTIKAYYGEKDHELVKICLNNPVHCNALLSIGIPPDNMVSPYLA